MTYKIFNRFIGTLILVLLSFSCTSNLDFKQVNNLKSTPVFIANFASFDVPANQFLVNGIEIPFAGEVSNFDVFRGNFINNSLNEADFYFEVENTINRSYQINFYFLDINNVPVYSNIFMVPAYTGTPNLITKSEIFHNASLSQLKSTRKLVFTVTMFPGVALTSSSSGRLKLRSSATVYLTLP